MTHDLLLLSTLKHEPLSLHTGWYKFDLNGIREAGNVTRIGDATLHVIVSDIGFDMPVLEFLNSNPVKL